MLNIPTRALNDDYGEGTHMEEDGITLAFPLDDNFSHSPKN